MSGSDIGDAVPAAAVARELARLRAENARLLRLLKLTAREAEPPGPVQAGFFEAPPGAVHAGSPPEVKVAFFGALFAARSDIYAVRWDNARTGPGPRSRPLPDTPARPGTARISRHPRRLTHTRP